jgi:hypothetical protein
VPIEDWIAQPPIAAERHERRIAASPERAIDLALEMRGGGPDRQDAHPRSRIEVARNARGVVPRERLPPSLAERREFVVGIGAQAKIMSGERIADPD